MRIFCIDIGNTRTHCATVDCGKSFAVESCADFPSASFAEILSRRGLVENSGADAVGWCSVVPKYSEALKPSLEKFDTMQLTCENSPIKIDIKAPQQLGQDRIADAVGAGVYLSAPYLVVDMGTAVTIDLVDENGNYAGGAIAPGMNAFSQYLSQMTAQLPSINPADADCSLVIGKNTLEAMYVGCAKGFCKLIDGLIGDIEAAYFGGKSAAEKTIFTGGSVELLPQNWLGGRRVDRNLAFIGLAKSFLFDRKKI